MRPSAASPTGTVIGPPVSTAFMPRVTPSVVLMATARTWFRPMCCCTSAVSRTGTPPLSSSTVERVVDLGQVLRLELDVEHRADDLDDAADVLRGGAGGVFFSVAIAVAM